VTTKASLICLVNHACSQPGQYLSHFLGHEGAGSILADVKDRGWATSLSSSCSNGAAGFEFLRININLTAIGLSESILLSIASEVSYSSTRMSLQRITHRSCPSFINISISFARLHLCTGLGTSLHALDRSLGASKRKVNLKAPLETSLVNFRLLAILLQRFWSVRGTQPNGVRRRSKIYWNVSDPREEGCSSDQRILSQEESFGRRRKR